MQTVEAPSTTLIKLVDLSVIPAAILIFSKVVGIVVLNAAWNLSWDVHAFSNAFFGLKLTYDSYDQMVAVISYSNLFMHIAALTGAVIALLKLFYIHPKHIKPSVVLKLAKKDKLHYIQSTFHLYTEALVWCAFLLVSDMLILLNYMQGLTYDWVLGIGVISTLFIVFILVRSVDRDLSINLKYK